MAEKTSQDQELKVYNGNCHCGAFRYSVKLPLIEKVVFCNCSICSKKGYLWAFPSSNDLFIVEQGESTLKEYEFNKRTMAHKFCPKCGTPVMGQRHREGPTIGVNVRTIHDIDLEPLKVHNYDGGKLEPAYEPPDGPTPVDIDSSLKTYNGSCHCGKVTFAVQSKPLEDLEMTECNCAICLKNGALWLYPNKEAVTVQGAEHLDYWSRYYKDKPEEAGHAFCSECGVSVLNKLGDSSGGKVDVRQPINVRAINGIDIDGLKIKKLDGKTAWGEPYALDSTTDVKG